MDWAGVLAGEFVKEEEMFMLAVGFVARMRKRTMDSEDEPAPIPNGKRPRWSSSDEGVKKDWEIIPVDSLDQATNDQPILEAAPNEDNVPQDEGIPT